MWVDQIIRCIAVFCLLIASVCLFMVDDAGTDLCVYEYISPKAVTYFSELQSSSADDPAMIGASGFVGLLMFFPLLFSYHRGWYVGLLALYAFLQLFVVALLDTTSFSEIIYDSIVHCQQYWLLTYVVGEMLFILLSLIFICRESQSKCFIDDSDLGKS